MKLTDIQTEILRLLDVQDATRGGAIVAWHDPEGQFTGTVEDLALPGVEVLCEREGHLFELKQTLNADLSHKRILLYRPRARALEGDWLADIEVRSAQFAADITAIQLRELNAPDTPELREALRTYRKLLSKKTNVKKLAKLHDSYQSARQLECALMALTLGAVDARPASILRAYLIAAQHETSTDALSALEQGGLTNPFTTAITSWTGYTGDVADGKALAQHLLLGALARDVPVSAIPSLAHCLSEAHAEQCATIVTEWRESSQAEELVGVCRNVEDNLGLERALSDITLDGLAQSDVFPCIDAAIIRSLLMRLIGALNAHNDPAVEVEALSMQAKRRPTMWYSRFACYYESILSIARILGFYRECGGDIPALPAERLWAEYQQTYSRIDRQYRGLHLAFAQALRLNDDYDLDDLLRTCCDGLENLYAGWFLRTLSRRWLDACQAELGASGHVTGIPRQIDFHMAEVEPLARNTKRAWVIVSDALRYEVAGELAERLERETQGSCDLGAMQAEFPTITKCGMAALLPTSSISMQATQDAGGRTQLSVLVDGAEVPTVQSREEALSKHHANAAALSFDEFFNKMGKSERAERIGDADVVYLYHNTIDAYGDKRETESKVFSACRESVDELCACVQLIVREFRASSVIITADHGFLYTSKPLAETDHAVAGDVDGILVEAGRRYAIARAGATSEPFVQVALPASGNTLTGFVPRGCIRIRKAGGGENYVHGGLSLQEMCVPVLRFANKRRGSKGFVETEYAKLSLVSAISAITNSLFHLELFQAEPVSGKVLPAEYEVFLGDIAHTPVTNIARVVADREEADPTMRTSTVSLTLKPDVTTSEHDLYRVYARNAAKPGEIQALSDDIRVSVAFAPSIDFGF